MSAPTNLPYASLASAVLLIGTGAVVVMSGNGGENGGAILIGLVVTTIPSLIAAAFAERNARDIRNGTVVEKVRQGTHRALAEAGVSTSTSPQATAALQSLEQLLRRTEATVQQNTEATVHNTEVHEHDEGKNGP